MQTTVKELISVHLQNKNLRENYKHYVFQCFLVFVIISILLIISGIFDGIVVASLGASSFILFATPHAKSSQSKYIIGGYICGILSGLLFNLLRNRFIDMSFIGAEYAFVVLSGAAVAFSMFLMVMTNLHHPPAAALALGLSVDPNFYETVELAIISVTLLCVFRCLCKGWLRNLV